MKLFIITTKDGKQYKAKGNKLEQAFPKLASGWYGEYTVTEEEYTFKASKQKTLEERVAELEKQVQQLLEPLK